MSIVWGFWTGGGGGGGGGGDLSECLHDTEH